MIVAIDGPAGTGKSTIAKLISKKLHIAFLNSGSFYRGITMALLDSKIDLDNKKAVIDFSKKVKMDYVNERLILNGIDVDDHLHDARIDLNAAKVSSIPEIRDIINKKLRCITKHLSLVCEGRDMTTVVFPNAEYKFYLDASLEAQAIRRYKQNVSDLTLEQIKKEIQERDKIDKNKAVGALKIAKDANYIDTSDLTIEQVCEIITSKIHN
ncbi:MAG: cytidylate kinase [Treponema sp. CETP13]|nr:MAG: cytidylate kinase [Treponema sp. CETP13]